MIYKHYLLRIEIVAVVFEGPNWNAWRCPVHMLSGVMYYNYMIAF